MKWFLDTITPEEIKKQYRSLAMQHHPDRGGDTDTMAEINDQYHAALKMCDGFYSNDDAGHTYRYRYHQDVEQAIMDKINILLRLQMASVEIALVGTWIWIHGDTRPHKISLKHEGCRWNAKRACWYWKPYAGRTHFNRNADFAGLAAKYGFRQFKHAEDETVAPNA